MNAPIINTMTLRDDVAIDFSAPASSSIYLIDLAERLARTPAVASGVGFYSLAQRSAILAQAIAGAEGALAGCYALLWFAPVALTGALEPEAELQLRKLGTFVDLALDEMRGRLARAVFDAVDLDPVAPAPVAKAVGLAMHRLTLSESLCVRRGDMMRARSIQAAGVRPLVNRISPAAWDKAHDQFLAAWRALAAAADLPRTEAWKGLP